MFRSKVWLGDTLEWLKALWFSGIKIYIGLQVQLLYTCIQYKYFEKFRIQIVIPELKVEWLCQPFTQFCDPVQFPTLWTVEGTAFHFFISEEEEWDETGTDET